MPIEVKHGAHPQSVLWAAAGQGHARGQERRGMDLAQLAVQQQQTQHQNRMRMAETWSRHQDRLAGQKAAEDRLVFQQEEAKRRAEAEQERARQTQEDREYRRGAAALGPAEGMVQGLEGELGALQFDDVGKGIYRKLMSDLAALRAAKPGLKPDDYAAQLQQWMQNVEESGIRAHQAKTPTAAEGAEEDIFEHPNLGWVSRTWRSGKPHYEILKPKEAERPTTAHGLMADEDWYKAVREEEKKRILASRDVDDNTYPSEDEIRAAVWKRAESEVKRFEEIREREQGAQGGGKSIAEAMLGALGAAFEGAATAGAPAAEAPTQPAPPPVEGAPPPSASGGPSAEEVLRPAAEAPTLDDFRSQMDRNYATPPAAQPDAPATAEAPEAASEAPQDPLKSMVERFTEWEAEKARTRDASVAARRALRSAQREATRLRRSGTPEQREAAKQRVLELRQRAKEAKRAANRVRHNPPNWRDSIAGMGEAVPESRPPAARDHAQPETPDVPEQVATPHRRADDKVPRGEGMFTPGSKAGRVLGAMGQAIGSSWGPVAQTGQAAMPIAEQPGVRTARPGAQDTDVPFAQEGLDAVNAAIQAKEKELAEATKALSGKTKYSGHMGVSGAGQMASGHASVGRLKQELAELKRVHAEHQRMVTAQQDRLSRQIGTDVRRLPKVSSEAEFAALAPGAYYYWDNTLYQKPSK